MHLGFWEFVLGMMIIGSISSIITGGMSIEKRKLRVRQAEAEAGGGELKSVVDEMHKEIMRLRERVQVLERLATDDDRRLADEIERLRRSESRV
jgi:hypothetical protein